MLIPRARIILTVALAAGKRADFIVLTANPLDDVANTQKIDAVYARGAALDRAALRSAWK